MWLQAATMAPALATIQQSCYSWSASPFLFRGMELQLVSKIFSVARTRFAICANRQTNKQAATNQRGHKSITFASVLSTRAKNPNFDSIVEEKSGKRMKGTHQCSKRNETNVDFISFNNRLIISTTREKKHERII